MLSTMTGSSLGAWACSPLPSPSVSVMAPERLTASSLIRLSRVMRRGEPGGRLKPRALSALASVSIVTTRPAERWMSS